MTPSKAPLAPPDYERLALAQKVLGVETENQLKALDPATLEELMNVRSERDLWKAQRSAPPFRFIKTSEGRYLSWRTEFVAVRGEAEAELLLAATPKSYSYKVDLVIGTPQSDARLDRRA